MRLRHASVETAKGAFTIVWFTLAGVAFWAVIAALPTAFKIVSLLVGALWRLI